MPSKLLCIKCLLVFYLHKNIKLHLSQLSTIIFGFCLSIAVWCMSVYKANIFVIYLQELVFSVYGQRCVCLSTPAYEYFVVVVAVPSGLSSEN